MSSSVEHESFPRVESLLGVHLRRREFLGIDPAIRLSTSTGGDAAPTAAGSAAPAGESGLPHRYLHLGQLGMGGMGTVYQVLDTDLNRRLALKVIRAGGETTDADDARTRELLTRFLEEAQVTGQLDHPGIVPLHEIGVDAGGRVYFTMRLVQGNHLGRVFRLARRGEEGWTRDQILPLMIRVCEAMAYAHSKGVVHRDLKPENVMVGRFGEAYVMDWGLAKVRGRRSTLEKREIDARASQTLVRTNRSQSDPDAQRHTLQGTVFGTPAFMPPEQARGDVEKIDARSDVYAFGALLYELVAGHAPYCPPDSNVAPHIVLRWVLEGPPKPLADVAPDAPADLVAICEKCMERDPESRYQDMLAVAEDLRCFLRGLPVSAHPLGPVARTMRWCRRNPIVTAFLVTQTLGVAIVLTSLANAGSFLVEQAALESAAMKSAMLEDVNTLYSANVVSRVDREHVTVTHDYAQHAGAIPLPATFLTELGDRISTHESGVRVRHFSEYPFRFRKDGGARDDFEREALAKLHADPTQPVHRFEDVDGRPTLRYATARVLKESCVPCHNTHPDSPKLDWKAGDVRGVLSVVRPLDRDIARTHAGLRTTLLVLGGVAVVLVVFGSVVLVRQGRAIDRGRGQS